jgi:hypothetical protein
MAMATVDSLRIANETRARNSDLAARSMDFTQRAATGSGREILNETAARTKHIDALVRATRRMKVLDELPFIGGAGMGIAGVAGAAAIGILDGITERNAKAREEIEGSFLPHMPPTIGAVPNPYHVGRGMSLLGNLAKSGAARALGPFGIALGWYWDVAKMVQNRPPGPGIDLNRTREEYGLEPIPLVQTAEQPQRRSSWENIYNRRSGRSLGR